MHHGPVTYLGIIWHPFMIDDNSRFGIDHGHAIFAAGLEMSHVLQRHFIAI